MKYCCTLISVNDIELSKKFYHDILGLEVIQDLGANATLTGGIALQTKDTWAGFLKVPESRISFGGMDSELYFEEDDIESFAKMLESADGIEYVHHLHEHAWGQRVIRFMDPDKHVIEVGENMAVVCKRFVNGGMTFDEAAQRMGVPVDYVRYLMTM